MKKIILWTIVLIIQSITIIPLAQVINKTNLINNKILLIIIGLLIVILIGIIIKNMKNNAKFKVLSINRKKTLNLIFQKGMIRDFDYLTKLHNKLVAEAKFKIIFLFCDLIMISFLSFTVSFTIKQFIVLSIVSFIIAGAIMVDYLMIKTSPKIYKQYSIDDEKFSYIYELVDQVKQELGITKDVYIICSSSFYTELINDDIAMEVDWAVLPQLSEAELKAIIYYNLQTDKLEDYEITKNKIKDYFFIIQMTSYTFYTKLNVIFNKYFNYTDYLNKNYFNKLLYNNDINLLNKIKDTKYKQDYLNGYSKIYLKKYKAEYTYRFIYNEHKILTSDEIYKKDIVDYNLNKTMYNTFFYNEIEKRHAYEPSIKHCLQILGLNEVNINFDNNQNSLKYNYFIDSVKETMDEAIQSDLSSIIQFENSQEEYLEIKQTISDLQTKQDLDVFEKLDLCKAYIKLNLDEQALEILEDSSLKNNGNALSMKGFICFLNNDPSMIKYYNEAIKLDESLDCEAYENIVLYCRLNGDLENYELYYDKYIEALEQREQRNISITLSNTTRHHNFSEDTINIMMTEFVKATWIKQVIAIGCLLNGKYVDKFAILLDKRYYSEDEYNEFAGNVGDRLESKYLENLYVERVEYSKLFKKYLDDPNVEIVYTRED